jgi:hypothetical protein
MTEPLLDHIVYAAPDIDELVASFTELTGVEPPLGGRHVGRGSRNYLVNLGGQAYLELIGPDDPTLPGRGTTAFGIDRLEAPRIVTWLIHPEDIEARVARARANGYDPGEIGPLSRRTPDGTLLEWRLTRNAPDNRDGLVPGLIDWLDAPHPTTSGLPELPLVSFMGRHPEPELVRRDLDALGVALELRRGAPGFEVVLDSPNGLVRLS